jgi:hypothetical protein
MYNNNINYPLWGAIMKRLTISPKWRWPALILASVLLLSGLTLAGLVAFRAHSKPAATGAQSASAISDIVEGQVAIDETYSGKTINLKTGDQLVLTVKYFPSTGYGWTLRDISNPAVLKKLDSIYNPNDC